MYKFSSKRLTSKMEITGVEPHEVIFREVLKRSEFSVVFLVVIRDTTCVMKVYHDHGPLIVTSRYRETNIHTCEVSAYRRLKEKGLCQQGLVPQFYGCIERLQPKLWQPNLSMFMNDELLPNAVLIEYIPEMQMLFLDNFTKERMAKFTEGIKLIHEARILHYDPKPRNMMVIPGNPDRMLWIDFDRAQTYDDKADLTPWQQKMLKLEEQVVIEFGVAMEQDCAEGRINRSRVSYN
ncbi:conserved hypothetical protein [Histoplasma capsulatum var. duboisii H88]|uniref:Protein kinase domain-containing protein n=1 Tax=Ajellomyces capsulatus (strain H88) TaxID=544711 RepID=F0UGE3_AJEC8|nr:conserved hypothetical protein [Histoplasma capsulatum var. duboisii H88]QSS55079.1 hypothetical protein I7I53_02856 [Histoplasma capsulatum var. duboisii H88]